MRVKIENQKITVIESDILVSNSVNVYTLYFEFDDTWAGYAKTAVFNNDTVSVEVSIVDNACIIPWETLVTSGYLKFGVRGVKDDIIYPTVWSNKLVVNEGTGEGTETKTPTPTVYQQLLTTIGDLENLETEDKSSIIAAINELVARVQKLESNDNDETDDPVVLKLETPTIHLETVTDPGNDDPEGESPTPKLSAPVIYLETVLDSEDDSEEMTPAILGTAILGRTILGDYGDYTPKLTAPAIELVIVEDADEDSDEEDIEDEQLDTPVIYLEETIDMNTSTGVGGSTVEKKLDVPVIYLETEKLGTPTIKGYIDEAPVIAFNEAGDSIVWNTVPDAEIYEVRVYNAGSGTLYNFIYETEYPLSNYDNFVEVGETIVIKVRARRNRVGAYINYYFNSDYSNELSYTRT